MTNRRRGKDFELEVVHAFKRWFPDACRGLQYQGKNGMYPPDVMGTPFYVECKRRKKQMERLDYWFRRAVELRDRHHPEYEQIVLVYRVDRESMMVVMSLSLEAELELFMSPDFMDRSVPWEWGVFQDAMDKKFTWQVAGKE